MAKDILEQVCNKDIVSRIPVGAYEMAHVLEIVMRTARLPQVHEASFVVLYGSTMPRLNRKGGFLDNSRRGDRLDPEMGAI